MGSIYGVAFSKEAWQVTIGFQLTLPVVLFTLSWLRYPAGIPLVRGCSVAISAACHPPPQATNPAEGLLNYGVIPRESDGGAKRVGLSCDPVEPLDPDQTYGKGMAGIFGRQAEHAPLSSTVRETRPPSSQSGEMRDMSNWPWGLLLTCVGNVFS